MNYDIQELNQKDQNLVEEFFKEHWGAEFIIAKNQKYYSKDIEGLAVFDREKIIGLLTYQIEQNEMGIISLDSLKPNKGIGSALLEKAKEKAQEANCRKIWLCTANDNLDALRFYQKKGFVLVKVYSNIVEEYRKIKPSIPEIGNFGIPIRDEIELEMILATERV